MPNIRGFTVNDTWEDVTSKLPAGSYTVQNKGSGPILVYEGVVPDDADALVFSSGALFVLVVTDRIHMRALNGSVAVSANKE